MSRASMDLRNCPLIFISTNFINLSEIINKLELKNFKLTEAVDLVENQIESLNKLTNEIGKEVSTKMNEVIKKSQRYEQIKLISRILNGQQDFIEKLKINYIVNEIICFNYYFNYSPIT